jgi:protein tyrosine phosphatase (PTP) superfamily phosphohydrolase (DUF442 family)
VVLIILLPQPSGAQGNPMKHVFGHLWRGRRPIDLAQMQALGFARIISLQSGVEDRWTESLVERQRATVAQFGIDYVYIQCRNWLPPTSAQVERVIQLIAASQVKTYIHCHSGVDRTGYMCAAARVKLQAWPIDRAVAEWKVEGRHWWFVWWEPCLRRALARIGA